MLRLVMRELVASQLLQLRFMSALRRISRFTHSIIAGARPFTYRSTSGWVGKLFLNMR